MSHPLRTVVSVPFGEYTDIEFQPVGIVRVETESSIWFVRSDRYQRLPREERPRPPEVSIEGRLTDAQWHGLRRCWWREHSDGETQLRLLPVVGPEAGGGGRQRSDRLCPRRVGVPGLKSPEGAEPV